MGCSTPVNPPSPPPLSLHPLSLLPRWGPRACFFSEAWKGRLPATKTALASPHPTLRSVGARAPCCLRGQAPFVSKEKNIHLQFGDQLARWTF